MLDFSVTFFITLLNIGILYTILRALLFKPVSKFMENRALGIKADLENAAREKARAEELRAQYEAALRSAEQETEHILREGRELAQKQAQALLEDARTEAKGIVQAARVQMEGERRSEAMRLKEETAALVLAATGRLLRRELNSEDAERSASALVAELELR